MINNVGLNRIDKPGNAFSDVQQHAAMSLSLYGSSGMD